MDKRSDDFCTKQFRTVEILMKMFLSLDGKKKAAAKLNSSC